MLSQIGDVLRYIDTQLTSLLSISDFTASLIITPTSKFITEFLIVTFILIFHYELIYWSGIYLGLWDYHAKHIFTEVPIHCAHTYIRINIIDQTDIDQVRKYYQLKKDSKYNVLNWNKLNQQGHHYFKLKKFIRYHLEFSPEDFESSPDPEYGSTIENLRQRVLNLFNDSHIYQQYHSPNLSKSSVLIFNNKDEEVTNDSAYLSKCNIETGNVCDCVVVV